MREFIRKIHNIKTKYLWNRYYKHCNDENIIYDNWLEIFNKRIVECESPIIDLGCGFGNNTKYLIECGKEVIACDYSGWAIEKVQKKFSVVKTECFDITKEFPFENNFTDIIIADLVLHYFSETTTKKILDEIKRVLKKDGVLIFRVNSINDFNYGAQKGTEVEKHYYQTIKHGYKRFFDEEDIKKFFKDWEIIYAKEEEMNKLKKTKQVWIVSAKVKK